MDVTDSEAQTYLNYTTEIIKTLPKVPRPDILWHYTTGANLIKIFESDSLWMTQISCLNDHREIRLASHRYKEALENYGRQKTLSDPEKILLQKAIKGLENDSAPINWWYVACFSAERDDLSQWRAYGGGEGGYAIGFKADGLVSTAFPDKALLAPVYYDEAVHADVAQKVAAATFRFFLEGLKSRGGNAGATVDDWCDAFLDGWSRAITYLGPVVKHPKFEPEHEWRLIRQLRDEDRPKMEYVQKQMMMSRHLPLNLGRSSAENKRSLLPIAEIMVGPSRYKEISRISVGDLLLTNGYAPETVKVSISDVPFQTV